MTHSTDIMTQLVIASCLNSDKAALLSVCTRARVLNSHNKINPPRNISVQIINYESVLFQRRVRRVQLRQLTASLVKPLVNKFVVMGNT